MRRRYGAVPFDLSRILSFSYSLELPVFGDKLASGSKLVGGALYGWQFSGIFQAMMGGPIGDNIGSEYAVNENTIGNWGAVSNKVDGAGVVDNKTGHREVSLAARFHL
jgi:hypothetical protein